VARGPGRDRRHRPHATPAQRRATPSATDADRVSQPLYRMYPGRSLVALRSKAHRHHHAHGGGFDRPGCWFDCRRHRYRGKWPAWPTDRKQQYWQPSRQLSAPGSAPPKPIGRSEKISVTAAAYQLPFSMALLIISRVQRPDQVPDNIL